MSSEPNRDRTSAPGGVEIDRFLDEPSRDLGDWQELWRRDLRFPVRSHRGLLGRVLVLVKRLLRPLVQAPQNDLWDRQGVFNLILLEHLEHMQAALGDLDGRVRNLETFMKEGIDEVMRHNDALFTRVDQKLDRYRREARDLSSQLQSALAVSSSEPGSAALRRAVDEARYLALEDRFRGTSEEIARRLEVYERWLRGRERALDLGCGRGEALRVLRDAGIGARGVDASAEMVRRCREQGLEAVEGDLFDHLSAQPAASLDAVLAFHVIEHLPATSIDRLIRLAWRVLEPGGVVILETPSPLSIAVAASGFWIDPTHRRPIHPESLRQSLEAAGFEPVERIDLNPYPKGERLPEIDLGQFAGEGEKRLADRVNRLRDRLDELIYGFRDYGMVGEKPPSGPA